MDTISILVIDDESSIREGAKRILSRMGFTVFTASRGDEGLKLLAEESISIVLLDMKMPGIDGMEVLRRIDPESSGILVIVITGFATVETAIEAMKQGAYDFIPKPFEPDQLRIVVKRAQEKLRLTREAEKLANERARTLSDLGTEKSRIRTIVESLPNGLVVTNSQGQVVLMNPAFIRELGLDEQKIPGQRIDDYIADEDLCQLVLEISRGKHIDFEDIPTYEFMAGEDKFLLARGQPVLGEKRECLGAVVSFVDITAMKVLDRLKSEFVAKVTHELRSPLATIHEQLALVQKDVTPEVPQEDQHLLSRAREKTRSLISLISDLLDLSRIESGGECHEARRVSLEELLQSIIEFMGDRAKAKKQTLSLKLPQSELPALNADPLALESIFGNLIANAINYTPEEGNIKVRVEQANQNLRISVSDNGFGIEARHLEKIFDRFYRVKNERTRFINGTGLGLPIVKGLVDALGGTITVQSEPDVGSTFTVLLPVAGGPASRSGPPM